MRLEAGLVGNQICSLRGSGEHANPAKLFETLGFSVSPPVNPFTACSPSPNSRLLANFSSRRQLVNTCRSSFHQPTATFLVAEPVAKCRPTELWRLLRRPCRSDQVPPPTCRLELNQCLDRGRTEAERKKGRHPRGQRPAFDYPKLLFLDVVHPIATLILRGLDLQIMLFGRAGQEAAHAVRLPAGSLPDLGQGGSLRPPDQCQDLGALALGARCGGLLRAGRLRLCL